jgi:hypothetical protein
VDDDAAVPSYAAARRALVVGASGFWASVALCLLISHSATTEHDGLSYFGIRADTLPIIVLGYASVSAGMLLAARRLPLDEIGRRLARPLRCWPACFALLLITPFDAGTAVNWTHMTLGVTLAVSQAVVTIWLCSAFPVPRVLGCAGMVLVGGIVCALSMPGTSFNFLLQGEVLFNAAFCAVLVTSVAAAAAVWGDHGDPDALRGALAPD